MQVCPTYYGVCSDVAALARCAHEHGVPLIVDEAHSAHFAFHGDFPTPALAQGADISIQSTHKACMHLLSSAAVFLPKLHEHT